MIVERVLHYFKTIVKLLLNDSKMILEGYWTIVKRWLTIDNQLFNNC